MKKFVLFFILIQVFVAQAQWKPNNGLCGGSINGVATHGSMIFVATEKQGVFISTDKGKRWSNKGGLPKNSITAITVKDNLLFASTDNNGVYRSKDWGNSWQLINVGIEDAEIIKMVSNSTCIIAAAQNSFYKSYNNGDTWTQHGVPTLLTDLKVDGENFYIVDFAEGAYISADNGLKWKNIYGSIGTDCVDADGDIVVVGGIGGVYRSTDLGNTWNNVYRTGSSIERIAINGATIILNPGSMSTDNGKTWGSGGDNNFSVSEVTNFHVDNGVVYACCKDSKLIKRAAQDTSWTIMNNSVLHTPAAVYDWPDMIDGNEQLMIAGSQDNLNYSVDGGENWEYIYFTLNKSVNGIRAIDTTLIAFGYSGYMYSYDKGKTWLENEEWKGENILDIKGKDGIWYMATEKGLFRSKDKGKTWMKLTILFVLPNEETVWTIEMKSNSVYVSSEYAIYKSTDKGDSWLPSFIPQYHIGFPTTGIYSFAVTDEDIYINTRDGLQVLNSIAAEWEGLRDNYRDSPVNVMISYGETLIVAFDGINKIYVKTKDKKWTSIVTPGIVYGMYVSNGQLYIVAPTDENINIWKADIKSVIPITKKVWVKTSVSLNSAINDIEWNEGVQFVATKENGIYKSSDNGNTWVEGANVLANMNITLLAASEGVLFAGSENGLLRSTDNGDTWYPVNHSISNEAILSLFAYKGKVFVSVPYAIYVTTDMGITWTQFQNGINEVYSVQFAANTNTVFAASTFGSVFSLPDGASEWTRLTEKDYIEYIVDIEVDGNNIYAIFMKNGFAKSTDNGKTWAIVNDSASNIEIKAIESYKGDLYVGNTKGVHISTNGGKSWTDHGLYGRSTTVLVLHDNLLYAGTENALIWKAELEKGATDIEEENINAVDKEKISLFPNPAYDRITIQIPEKKQGTAHYTITDQLGNIVSEGIIPEKINELRISTSNIPAGMYIFSTEVNGKRVQEKFVVMR